MRRKRLKCITDDNDLLIDNYNYDKQNDDDTNKEITKIILNNYDIMKLNFNKAFFLLNINSEILYVNEKWENLCQYKNDEIYKKKITFLHGTETNIIECNNFLRKLILTGSSNMLNINYTKNNKKMYVYVEGFKTNTNIISDNIPYYYGTIEET